MPQFRKGARALDANTLRPDSRIAVDEAVRIIAERVGQAENGRAARDRVRKRILYGLKENQLPGLPDGGFLFGVVALWASRKWPGSFDDLPKHAPGQVVVTSSTSIVARGFSAPNVPEESAQTQQLIAEQAAQISALKSESEVLSRQLRAEKIEADRWRRFRKKSGRRSQVV